MFTNVSRIRTVPSPGAAYRGSVKPGEDAAHGTIIRTVELAAWDCPECGVTASVRDEVCDVCSAELDEFRLEPWGESPQVTHRTR